MCISKVSPNKRQRGSSPWTLKKPHLLVPTASISSMKTMDGACSSATLNISRTSFGPSPWETNNKKCFGRSCEQFFRSHTWPNTKKNTCTLKNLGEQKQKLLLYPPDIFVWVLILQLAGTLPMSDLLPPWQEEFYLQGTVKHIKSISWWMSHPRPAGVLTLCSN